VGRAPLWATAHALASVRTAGEGTALGACTGFACQSAGGQVFLRLSQSPRPTYRWCVPATPIASRLAPTA